MAMNTPDHREEELRQLVGLPPRPDRRARAGKSRVRIDEVCRVLDLPEPRYRELLASDRWLVGGAVMRWLSPGIGRTEIESADYDYFFPSVEVVNRSLDELIAAGFLFRCFRSYKAMCPLCGGPGELVGADGPLAPLLIVAPIRCPHCGEFDPDDPDGFRRDRLLRLRPELLGGDGVRAVELLSPRGDTIHLTTVTLAPTPGDVLASADFSMIQFLLDDEYLYFGPYAWSDLLHRRLRLVSRSNSNYYRYRKFMALGFRPDAASALGFLRAAVRWHYALLLRGGLRLLRPKR